jgi:Excalibur calcium-binding domain
MSSLRAARTLRRVAVVAAAAVFPMTLAMTGAQAAPPYANCTAVWQQLGRPIFPQDAGYNFQLDADKDGVGCENKPGGVVAKNPPAARVHALRSGTYNHLGNPARGQLRVDTWVSESFTTWPTTRAVQGVARAVKVAGAVRVQVNYTQLESENLVVWARNSTAVNSGTAGSVKEVTANVAASTSCASTARLRVRTSVSVRWTDGSLTTTNVVGPLTAKRWCRP